MASDPNDGGTTANGEDNRGPYYGFVACRYVHKGCFSSETDVGACGPEIGCALGNDEEDVMDGREVMVGGVDPNVLR